MTGVLISALLYPGLLFVLALGAGTALLLNEHLPPALPTTWGREALLAIGSILMSAAAAAVLPWPLHQASTLTLVGNITLIWTLIEAAFWLPTIGTMLSPAPQIARATIRETQISASGRVVVWMAIGVGLAETGGWTMLQSPGRVALAVAALLALPAALQTGPFAAERPIAAADSETGLDRGTTGLVRLARMSRNGVLLGALVIAMVPLERVQGAVGLVLVLAVCAVVLALIRQIAVALPRLTVPHALRWCWWRALPIALIGIVYLALIS